MYKQSSVDLESYARNRGIFVKYPKTEIGCLQPFCYVDYEVKRTELHVQTFSAFPDQAAMIKTQSLFDFR